MGAREELRAKYAEAQARLGKAPAPVKKVVVKPAYADVEAEISKRQRLLDGCPLSTRLKMLIVDTLADHNVSWADAMKHYDGLRNFQVSAEKTRNLAARRAVWTILRDDGMGLKKIGSVCGFDHTSVHYAIRKRPRTRPLP